MPRASARKLWTAKLTGAAMPAVSREPSSRSLRGESTGVPGLKKPYEGRVLGIDPSLRGTGLALLEFHPGRQPLLLRCQTLRVPSKYSMAVALAEIHKGITAFLAVGELRHVALEQTIYVQNIRTAQILGAARGAAIAAVALHGFEVFEYPPLRVKQAVVGLGRASKEQMARTVMALLGHGRTLALDEADAAGVALCHAFTWRP